MSESAEEVEVKSESDEEFDSQDFVESEEEEESDEHEGLTLVIEPAEFDYEIVYNIGSGDIVQFDGPTYEEAELEFTLTKEDGSPPPSFIQIREKTCL